MLWYVSSTYSDSSKEINDKNPKFKIDDNVRISKYIYIFLQKVTIQICLKKCLWLKKLKICYIPVNMLLMILMEKKLLERFTKTNCRKTNKKSLELKMELKKRW